MKRHRLDRLTSKIRQLKNREPCACGRGVLRATDVVSRILLVSCTSRACKAFREYYLPSLDRKIIYLDTSVIWNMARSPRPRFRELYDALERAIYKNVVVCVVSSIAIAEIELAPRQDEILAVAHRLGTIHVRPEVEVQDAQLYRAFGRFRRNEPPRRERRPPAADAFDEDVRAWPGLLSFKSRFPSSPEELQRRREAKTQSVEALRLFYAKYAGASLSFHEIAVLETTGYCQRAAADAYLTRLLASTLERDGLTPVYAMQSVEEFFASEHVRLLPAAVINGKLHAALALASRTEKPRALEEGDAYDIEHLSLSTYLPYVDILVTDNDMAATANRRDVQLTLKLAKN